MFKNKWLIRQWKEKYSAFQEIDFMMYDCELDRESFFIKEIYRFKPNGELDLTMLKDSKTRLIIPYRDPRLEIQVREAKPYEVTKYLGFLKKSKVKETATEQSQLTEYSAKSKILSEFFNKDSSLEDRLKILLELEWYSLHISPPRFHTEQESIDAKKWSEKMVKLIKTELDTESNPNQNTNK